MNKAMTQNPPERHTDIVWPWAQIGLGPGQDVDTQPEDTKRGPARATVAGRELRGQAMRGLGPVRNGWNFLPVTMGRAGDHGDFLTSGAIQCLAGIIANDPEEAVYPNVFVDADGEPLRGDSRYHIRFLPRQLPPVGSFWSLTLYGLDADLVDNSLDRYALRDRTPGLQVDQDRVLTVYVQSASPGAAHESNRLPSAAGETFYFIIRLYRPKPEAVDRTWMPPRIERVD